MAEWPFDKETMGVTHEFNQPSQQKPGTEMGLNQQKHCQLVLKGTDNTRQDEGRLSGFLDPTGSGSRAANMPYAARKGENDSELIQRSSSCLLSSKGWGCP